MNGNAVVGWIAWLAGLGLLAVSAGAEADQTLILAQGGAAVALVACVATGMALRRVGGLDLGLACLVVFLALHAPTLDGVAQSLVVLGGLALAGLGYGLLGTSLRMPQAPLVRVAGPAALVLGLAAAGTLALLQGPRWLAGAVSVRWTHSLDATSAVLAATLGLGVVCVAAGVTALRLVLRMRGEPSPSADRT